ncbi:hypothetical protein CFAM422_008568 [Trichoderma lentiforme]|uniref:Uncharacterized protein n=1 Tax=Trichoderma lentiforme TaxID=1567552 RepID=A0A9P5CCG2_9HYPO|nr:hypothetical protein CFAM422_008568 [Trichoderma lentiforme]
MVSVVHLTSVSSSNKLSSDYVDINSDTEYDGRVHDGPNIIHTVPNTPDGSEDSSGSHEDEDTNDSELKE